MIMELPKHAEISLKMLMFSAGSRQITKEKLGKYGNLKGSIQSDCWAQSQWNKENETKKSVPPKTLHFFPNHSMNPWPLLRVRQEGHGVFLDKNVYALLRRSFLVLLGVIPLWAYTQCYFFSFWFFSVILFLKRMYRKYIVLLYLCLFFLVFSLSPWTSAVFPKQRANRSIRKPSYHWPQGTSTAAEAGLEVHRRLDTFHDRGVCSWLAFPPAHHRGYSWPSSPQKRNDRAARMPPQSISLKYAAPESPLHLPPSLLWPIRWPDANEWLFWSQWEPQPEMLPLWQQL